jgi:hypothetical protein
MENNNSTTQTTNCNPESQFKKYLYNEVTLIIAIGAFVWGIYGYITNPIHKFDLQIQEITINAQNVSKQMQNLKDNDLHSLTLKTNEIVDNQQKIMIQITKLETLLEQYMGQ